MNRQYRKEEIEDLLKSTDSTVVIDALMYLCFNICDPEWVQDKCVEAIESGINEDIKGLGITCIGHVARMYATVNRRKVIPVLESKLKDSSLGGRAHDTLDDIETFVKMN
ncbi:hypothetical protein [Pseudoduganella chitinolytica]|uniref:HEAT repeat domain-containing protein n=1 Tax=Pseudoduganella chitinolytica TaxID=34070 RepID=A0ABY8BBL4_9BURK|nr:hypothetical protein [Pseudoduganella chitinolytica]WEF33190.1 hypothetical protein PX653_28030 [Pseudoduganella chitinolytica]